MGNHGEVNLPKTPPTPQLGDGFKIIRQKKIVSSTGNVKGHIYTWPKSLKPELQKALNSILLAFNTIGNAFKKKIGTPITAKYSDLKSKISPKQAQSRKEKQKSEEKARFEGLIKNSVIGTDAVEKKGTEFDDIDDMLKELDDVDPVKEKKGTEFDDIDDMLKELDDVVKQADTIEEHEPKLTENFLLKKLWRLTPEEDETGEPEITRDVSVVERKKNEVERVLKEISPLIEEINETIREQEQLIAQTSMKELAGKLQKLISNPQKKLSIDEEGNISVTNREKTILLKNIGKNPKTREAVEIVLKEIREYSENVGEEIELNDGTKIKLDVLLQNLEKNEWFNAVIDNNQQLGFQLSSTLNAVRGERLQQYNKAFEEAGVDNKLKMSKAGVLKVVKRKKFAKKKTGKAAKELIKNIHQEIFKELALIKEELEAIEKKDPNLEKTPMEKKTELEARLKTIEDTIKLIEDNKWAQKVYSSLKKEGGDFYATEQLLGKLEGTTQSAKTTFHKFTWQDDEQIINRLIDPKEPTFRSDIMDSYRWLMTTEDFFDKLITKFDSLDTEQSRTDDKKEEKEIIATKQQTIKNIISTWLSDPSINSNENLSNETLDKISIIFGGNPPKQNKIDKPGPKTTTTEEKKSAPPGYFSVMLDKVASNKISKNEREQLLNQIADEIFKEGADLFKMMGAGDLSGIKWPIKEKDSPSLYKIINFHNQISAFVSATIEDKTMSKEIDTNEQKNKRKLLLEFFIDLEEKCIERGDFFSSQAISGGLNNSPISRLFQEEYSQTKIDKDHLNKLENWKETIWNPTKNFELFKIRIESYEKSGKNFIPWVPKQLQEIAFITEGNPINDDMHPNQSNMEAIKLLSTAQRKISSAQKKLESVERPTSTLLSEIIKTEYNEDKAHANSLKIQPRE